MWTQTKLGVAALIAMQYIQACYFSHEIQKGLTKTAMRQGAHATQPGLISFIRKGTNHHINKRKKGRKKEDNPPCLPTLT
jgi:hypothetical protein